jgi:hypothetical protein
MSSLKSRLNVLTGASTRHNKALREINDWTEAIQSVLTSYDLYGNSGPDTLLSKSGQAKFDLTSLSYKGRPLIERAGKIKGPEITKLIHDVVDCVESLRRLMIHPSLQMERVKQGTVNLRSSYEKLHDALATIEYL